MTAPALRKDAARNRQRILDAGRACVDQGTPIQLNDIARTAGVGVATVYRHFPTPQALTEAVAQATLESLAATAEQALTCEDPWAALHDFLTTAVDAQLRDASLSPVLAAPETALPSTAEARGHLTSLFGRLFARIEATGQLAPGVTQADLTPLMCGVAFAARMHPADTPDAQVAAGRHYLDIMLNGLRAR
ncbi:TetR/AcrR family transcriptional regulator [Kineosporia babensis]|uniref:TetR/AcrR family transcriptional regulator n=1 Tax=Kineosporia babensis TaxID=499548 RepID=A0A9X1NLC6_9ACTN|nr:TetR/AcrR family transcriptional regulator [Kineosporia babensis]MCD5316220.1 TetR/AcrR family transcriptional regulator [Kineosporia babensis]